MEECIKYLDTFPYEPGFGNDRFLLRQLKIVVNSSSDEFQLPHDDVKAVIQEMADANAPGIKGAQRGVRSWKRTRLSSEEVDAWEVIQSRKKGDPLNAEQTLAVREIWVQSGKAVRSLADEVLADPDSQLAQLSFRKMLATHASPIIC